MIRDKLSVFDFHVTDSWRHVLIENGLTLNMLKLSESNVQFLIFFYGYNARLNLMIICYITVGKNESL
jgi:hypothetical protein